MNTLLILLGTTLSPPQQTVEINLKLWLNNEKYSKHPHQKIIALLKEGCYVNNMHDDNYYFGEGKRGEEFLKSVFNKETGLTYVELLQSIRNPKPNSGVSEEEIEHNRSICDRSLDEYIKHPEFRKKFSGKYIVMEAIPKEDCGIVYDSDDDEFDLLDRMNLNKGTLFMEYISFEGVRGRNIPMDEGALALMNMEPNDW